LSTKKLQIIGSLGSNVEIDTTLTKEGYAADAKSIGDALELKADQASVDTLSDLVGNTSVSDQITSAVSQKISSSNHHLGG
jgi:hypothetical protein